MTMQRYTLLLLLVFLPSCVGMGDHLVELRAKNPTGESFSQALAAEYLRYAEARLEEEHPLRANYFAGKGLDALAGDTVELEKKPALEESRQALLAVLTPDVKEIAPAKAARAQLMFDCWAEKEGVCKEGFAEALADLQFIADALVHGEDNHFIVPFTKGSSGLSGQGNSILDIIATRVKTLGDYKVNIEPPAKKGKLATTRRLAIEKGLIARGVDAGRIQAGRAEASREVTLSTDKKKDADSVVLFIQTYTQPPETSAK